MEREHTPLTREEFVAVLSGDKTLAEITRERNERHREKLDNKQRGKLQAEWEAEFRKMPTRQLLKLRDYGCREYAEREQLLNLTAYDYALYKVLASRPHVPRGKEQTALRKAKAKQRRGQGKSKNR